MSRVTPVYLLSGRGPRPDRPGERTDGVRSDRPILGVFAERIPVSHITEFPHAMTAHRCLGKVRVEMPRPLRREHAARAGGEVAVGVELRRAGVGHELDLRIAMTADSCRLQLQERRGERV